MAARAATETPRKGESLGETTQNGASPSGAGPLAGAMHSMPLARHNGWVDRRECCALYHRAVELVGKRWSGAILLVLMDGPLRFSQVRQFVPEISDRLLSERLKELEGEGIVERQVLDSSPPRVQYGLTEKGRALEPAVRALKLWANEWLA